MFLKNLHFWGPVGHFRPNKGNLNHISSGELFVVICRVLALIIISEQKHFWRRSGVLPMRRIDFFAVFYMLILLTHHPKYFFRAYAGNIALHYNRNEMKCSLALTVSLAGKDDGVFVFQ